MKIRLKRERLALLIARSRLSQNHWAQRIGISKGHLSNLISGRHPYPRAETRNKLLEESGLQFDEMFEIENDPAFDAPSASRLVIEGRTPERTPRNMDLLYDLRLAFRLMIRDKGFSLVALLTLTLGVGASSAIFSLLNAALFQSLPFFEADRIVVPGSVQRGADRDPTAYPDFLDWQGRRDTFRNFAVFNRAGLDLTGEGDPVRLSGLAVTAEYFDVLRTRPEIGRTLSAEDYGDPSIRRILLAKGLWDSRFGAAGDILGRTLELSENSYTVVGVIDPEQTWPQDVQFWVPLDFGSPLPDYATRRDNFFLNAIGRLADGVDLETAQAVVSTLAEQAAAADPGSRAGVGYRIYRLRDWVVEDIWQLALAILLATVLAVQLIACVNLANLSLVRAVSRRREIAVRMALGAGRGRLIRQFLVESSLLAVTGAAAGIILASQLVQVLASWFPDLGSAMTAARVDLRVLLFALLASFLTTLIFGLAPIAQSGKTALSSSLNDSSRGASGHDGNRLRRWLVTGEVALSLTLLVVAGLLLRSFRVVSAGDPGFDGSNLHGVQVSLPSARYPDSRQRTRFFEQLLDELARIPELHSVSGISALPLRGGGINLRRAHVLEHAPRPPAGPEIAADWVAVTQRYFETLKQPLLRGRSFQATDSAGSPPVMIINETMARRMFGDEDPLGRRIVSWRDENLPREIVGVVRDVRSGAFGDQFPAMVYVPAPQAAYPPLTGILVRSEASSTQLSEILRQAIWRLDAKLPLRDSRTLAEFRTTRLAGPRTVVSLLVGFALLALTLAGLGIYGVISYAVSQRRREIGIRLALGAHVSDVVSLVIRQGGRITLLGLLLGLAGALVVSRGIGTLLIEVQPIDPPTFGAALLLLGTVALLACFVPARRAARLDPVKTLRAE